MIQLRMVKSLKPNLPADLASELEQKYFWWDPVGSKSRSDARIVTQAMEFASFADIKRLEKEVGQDRLVGFMREAEPGWISERSWEFWRGRLSAATGQTIPDQPPRRSLHAKSL